MDTKQHTGLPVAGYVAQKNSNVALVNFNKQIEERVMRQIDDMMSERHPAVDKRMVAIARTKTQEAFMWLNRAVFQPSRIDLPEDIHTHSEPPGAPTCGEP
jgi:hypothetical protein